jgi:S1-C subfamily serine protease
MPKTDTAGLGAGLGRFSDELAAAVERAAPSVVRVDDGTRLTATGIAWSADLVVSTSHGVERDEDLAVVTGDGERLAAHLVGRDGDTDIALLRVSGGTLPPIARASGESVKVGNLALALGRPGDGGLQATLGIVSARYESDTNGKPGYVVYTDATLYPGFSGGALVNVVGEAVGMTNLVFGRGRGVAVGVPVVEAVVDALLKRGGRPRGHLGVRVQAANLPESLRAALGIEQASGLLVVDVEAGSAAEAAGVMLGDTLLAINGRALGDVDDLRAALRGLSAGDAAALRLARGGQLTDAQATLRAREA